MAEIGIHLDDIVVAVLQSPFEAADVGGAKSQLARTLYDVNAACKFICHQAFHDVGCSVRASVVDDKDVESFLQRSDGSDDGLDVLFLVVGRDDDNGVGFQFKVHSSKFIVIVGRVLLRGVRP